MEEAAPATYEPGSACAWLRDRVAADRDVSAAAETEAGDGGGRKLLVLRGLLVSFDGAHHYCGIALQERDSRASRVTESDRVSRTR